MNSYIDQLSELLQRARAGDDPQKLRSAFRQLKKQINHEINQVDEPQEGRLGGIDDPIFAKFAEASDQLLAAIDCALAYLQDQQPLEPAWVYIERAEEALQEGHLLVEQARELTEQEVYLGSG